MLSRAVISRLLESTHLAKTRKPWFLYISQVIANAFLHGVAFCPVLFNSLSDGPAALLALIAIWLLYYNTIRYSTARVCIAGFLFGFAAWMRAFYLYPVLVLLGAILFYWLISRKRKWGELMILTALIPIGVQFVATNQVHGYFGYIERGTSATWSEIHLSNRDFGYDTLLPSLGHYWASNCKATTSKIQARTCLTLGRTQFYFGSYSLRTYLKSTSDRWWSVFLIFINALGVLGSVYFIIATRKRFPVVGIIAFCFLSCIVGEGLLIIPEQRFLLTFYLFIWVVGVEVFWQKINEMRAKLSIRHELLMQNRRAR
jgi:hypothetical protein